MTREEAIEVLQQDIPCEHDNDLIEALDMAIKALEQEPCEDAISRQAVNILVDELARAISDERCCMSRGRSTASIMQDILDLPSVRPQEPFNIDTYCKEHFCVMVDKDVWEKAEKALKQEPKTGRWQYVQYDYNPGLGNWHCSECRCVVVECVDKNEKGGIPLYKYCPQCGAKMKVGE